MPCSDHSIRIAKACFASPPVCLPRVPLAHDSGDIETEGKPESPNAQHDGRFLSVLGGRVLRRETVLTRQPCLDTTISNPKHDTKHTSEHHPMVCWMPLMECLLLHRVTQTLCQ